METRPNPLDKLFESSTDTNRDTARFLLDYLRIDPQTLDVLFVPDLTVRSRILLYLMAMNLMNRVGKRKSKEVRAKEISLGVNAEGNTVRPILMQLLQERMIDRSQEGKYFVRLNIPNNIKAYLEKVIKSGKG